MTIKTSNELQASKDYNFTITIYYIDTEQVLTVQDFMNHQKNNVLKDIDL